MVIGCAGAHQVAEWGLLQREEACAQAALRREPDAIARAAEGLAHRGDETDAAWGTVRELETGGRSWAGVDDRNQREEVFDLLLDAAARDDLLVGPRSVPVGRHVLDEAHFVALVPSQAREVDDLVVVVTFHHHHVQLDRPKSRLARRLDS